MGPVEKYRVLTRGRLCVVQIREELVYHNIRLYPFDTEENDEEEVQLNESIRVSPVNCTPGERVFILHSEHDPLRGCWL